MNKSPFKPLLEKTNDIHNVVIRPDEMDEDYDLESSLEDKHEEYAIFGN